MYSNIFQLDVKLNIEVARHFKLGTTTDNKYEHLETIRLPDLTKMTLSSKA